MRGARLVLSAMAVVLSACGQPPDQQAFGLVDEADAAKTGRVVCDGTGAHVRTPAIRTHLNGVHLRVVNRGEEPLIYEWLPGAPDEDSMAVGYNPALAIEDFDHVNPGERVDLHEGFDPGPTTFRCFTLADALSDDAVSAPSRLVVVANPDRAWIPPSLDCEAAAGGTMGYQGFDPKIPPKRPRDMAADLWAPSQPGDEIVAAGYPKGTERWFVLVRGGQRINAASWNAADEPDMKGYWIPGSFESCSVE